MSALDTLLSKSSIKLPTLPVIALKVIESCKDENFSTSDLSELISSDPALALKTLAVSNSSYYTSVQSLKVDSIERAISLMGADSIKNIAVSFTISRNLQSDDLDFFDMDDFWKRSITGAIAAEALAKHLDERCEDVFLRALLMDLGSLVMALCSPDLYKELIEEGERSMGRLIKLERKIFGFDHQEVSRDILKKWDLPESIYMPMAFHHDAANCPPKFTYHVDMLRFSSFLSRVDLTDMDADVQGKLKFFLFDKFGLNEPELNAIIEEVSARRGDIFTSFGFDPEEETPESELPTAQVVKDIIDAPVAPKPPAQPKEAAPGDAAKKGPAPKKAKGKGFLSSIFSIFKGGSS